MSTRITLRTCRGCGGTALRPSPVRGPRMEGLAAPPRPRAEPARLSRLSSDSDCAGARGAGFFLKNQFVISAATAAEDGLLFCSNRMRSIGPLKPISLAVKSGPTGLVRAGGQSCPVRLTAHSVLCPPRGPQREAITGIEAGRAPGAPSQALSAEGHLRTHTLPRPSGARPP